MEQRRPRPHPASRALGFQNLTPKNLRILKPWLWTLGFCSSNGLALDLKDLFSPKASCQDTFFTKGQATPWSIWLVGP